MWVKIVEFLLNQGLAGIAILALGGAAWIFYKDNQKKEVSHHGEKKEITEKFIQLSNEAVKYIQENTSSLKELREDIKEDRHARERVNERMLQALQDAIRDYRRGE